MLRAQHDSSTMPSVVSRPARRAERAPVGPPRMTGNKATDNNGDDMQARRIVIAPNCSLNGRETAVFLMGVGGVSLAVAMVFAVQGFWPILPFAGAEIALLVWAMMHSQRRGRYREVVTVGDTEVTLERGFARGEQREVFSRSWVRARLEPGRWRECRVVLAAHGRHVEVGACLTSEERKALHRRLRQILAAA